MYRVLIWGAGYGYSQYINGIRYQELLEEIQIVGVTGKDNLYDRIDGIPFLPCHKITKEAIDYVIITSDVNFVEIADEAAKLGFSEDMLVKARVFMLPDFCFSDYISLRHPPISIISNNCWGGTLYHSLGMKFYSPFINMFEEDEDYLRLLHDLKYYMGLKLKAIRFQSDKITHRPYPVCRLGDAELHFNHYADMDEVEKSWYERVKRINWDNLFVMMFTENPQVASAFDELDYEKKICFVPFKSPLKSAYYLQLADRTHIKGIPFWQIVNKIASGHYHDYGLIDLLCNGRVIENRYV